MSLLDQASLILTPNGYKASKLYSVKPTDASGDMVVSRATTATRVNSSNLIESVAIDVPRLDYTGGGCPKILVEPARTNLVLYSEEFNNAIWSKTGVTVTANAVNSPSGTLTADLVTPTISDAKINQGFNPTGALQHNFSVYLRSATGSSFSTVLRITRDSPFSSVANTVITVTTEWQRFNLSFTALDTTTHQVTIGGGSTLSTGENFYAWGAQCELGSNASSYIPTTTATVTRNADVISKTGVSSLIGQTEGTVVMDLNFANVGVEKYILILRDTASTNTISIRRLTTGAITFALAATTSSGTTNQSSAVLANGNYKIAYKYISGSIKIFINGVLLFTLTPTFTFGTALSIIDLGHQNSLAQLNDTIKVLQLYTTALTDAQCISLTTP